MKNIFSLFDTLIDPVFVLNHEKIIIYCNESAATLAELSQRKIINKMQFKNLFQFRESIDICTSIDNIDEATPLKEIEFKTQNGNPIKVQFTVQPTHLDPNQKQWVIFLRDVTLEERLQKKYHSELDEKEKYISELKEAKEKLEDYSKTLEKKVEERTEQIRSINRTMKALLDSLGQGFLIFNQEGFCLDIYSKACLDIFEKDPAHQKIWEVLNLPTKEIDGFKKWMQTIFSEMLPFEDLSVLGPAAYKHSQGRHISLNYYPLRNEENSITGIVLVGTDITSLIEAQNELKLEKEYAQFVIKLIQRKKQVSQFIDEIAKNLQELKSILSKEILSWDKNAIFSIIHTLKGGAGTYSQALMAQECHHAEDLLSEVDKTFTEDQAKRFITSAEQIAYHFDQFKVKAKEILGSHIVDNERTIEILQSDFDKCLRFLQHANATLTFASELEEKYLLEPIQSHFFIYQDHIERMALTLNKKVQPLDISKEEIKISPGIYNHLFACLIHSFNNSLDHGIEAPEERFELGKNEYAKISVDFEVIKNNFPQDPILKIIISDDGRGISPDRIRAKLEKLGIDASNETDEQVIQHIFDDQFSTKEEVTQTSGRGVGMQAIKEAAERLGGKVHVESSIGIGTQLIISIPYFLKKEELKAA